MKCTGLPSFTTIFTGLNILISILFLLTYLELIPSIPSYSTQTAIYVEPMLPLPGLQNDSISFKDISLKFHFVRFPDAISNACQGGNLTLLVVVQSAPASFEARRVIRDTWANKDTIAPLKNASALVVFLIGNGDIASRQLLDEMDKHEDIIAVDVEDSYKNLIFKTALTLHISQSYCTTPFLLKVDEDVVFNAERFLSEVGTTFRSDSPSIYCKTWHGSRPARDRDNEWFVSEHQFRGRRFPIYCAGPSYALTSNAVSALLTALPAFNLITVEDVFVTGIVAQNARVQRVGLPDRFKSDYTVVNYTESDCPGRLLSIHNLKTEAQIRNTWSFLSRNC